MSLVKAYDMSKEELIEFSKELIEHLNWCGWGDSWERECSEDLRKKANEFEESLNVLG